MYFIILLLFSSNMLTISTTLKLEFEKTIAFGGVATGSIKAKLTAKAAGHMRRRGWMPNDNAISSGMGMSSVVMAVLLVTSVANVAM